jgi:hypothetical protein
MTTSLENGMIGLMAGAATGIGETRRKARAVPLLAVLALGACNLPVADKESDALARGLYDELRTGADLARDPHLDPSLRAAAAALPPAVVRAQVPRGPWTKLNVTGWNYASSSGAGANATLSHDYVYPGRTVHVMTALHKDPGQAAWTIVGFRAIADGADQPIVLGALPKPDSNDD